MRTSVAALVLACTGLMTGHQFANGASPAPLADAAERHDVAAVRSLLTGGTDVNQPQPDGMTPLHWAVYHDNLELTRSLLEAGANVTAVTRYGVAPLSLACQNGNGEIVKLLLTAGADANAKLPGDETALMTAARTGRLEPVAALLEHGAEVNAVERRGQTALMWAAAEGHVQVVEALLNAGADAHKRLPSGFTACFFAARNGRADVLPPLIAAGIDINDALEPDPSTDGKPVTRTNALLLAVESGHFEAAARLIDAGADPNAHPAGYTALHALTWVRKPIRGDGDPSPIGSGDMTSLDLVRYLESHGADVNAHLAHGTSGRGRFTTTGSTPFLLAARASDVPLMKLLLELGTDPQLPNADHATPLLAATGVGALGDGDDTAGTDDEALEAVRFLLGIGADPNIVDDNGETAMHGAAYQSRFQLVSVLAEHGADVKVWDRPNKWGWTPLLIARGHRPGNYRPAPDTIAAIVEVMKAQGVEVPPDPGPPKREKYTNQ